jgi:hypothetical protein
MAEFGVAERKSKEVTCSLLLIQFMLFDVQQKKLIFES